MSPFWILLELRVMGGDNGTELQDTKSSSQIIITTNIPTPALLQAGCLK